MGDEATTLTGQEGQQHPSQEDRAPQITLIQNIPSETNNPASLPPSSHGGVAAGERVGSLLRERRSPKDVNRDSSVRVGDTSCTSCYERPVGVRVRVTTLTLTRRGVSGAIVSVWNDQSGHGGAASSTEGHPRRWNGCLLASEAQRGPGHRSRGVGPKHHIGGWPRPGHALTTPPM